MYIYSFIYLYTYIDIHRAPAKEVESHKPAGCIDFYLNICILIYWYSYTNIYRAPAKEEESHTPAGCIYVDEYIFTFLYM